MPNVHGEGRALLLRASLSTVLLGGGVILKDWCTRSPRRGRNLQCR